MSGAYIAFNYENKELISSRSYVAKQICILENDYSI